jgi:hypothetical protein
MKKKSFFKVDNQVFYNKIIKIRKKFQNKSHLNFDVPERVNEIEFLTPDVLRFIYQKLKAQIAKDFFVQIIKNSNYRNF